MQHNNNVVIIIILLKQHKKIVVLIHAHHLCPCCERWVRSTHFLVEHVTLYCSSNDTAYFVIYYQPMCTPWLVLLIIAPFTRNVQHNPSSLVILQPSNPFYSYTTRNLYKKFYCPLCTPFMHIVNHSPIQINTHAKCSICVIVIKRTYSDDVRWH